MYLESSFDGRACQNRHVSRGKNCFPHSCSRLFDWIFFERTTFLCSRSQSMNKTGTFDWLHTYTFTTITKTKQRTTASRSKKVVVIQYILTWCRFSKARCVHVHSYFETEHVFDQIVRVSFQFKKVTLNKNEQVKGDEWMETESSFP